MTMLLTTLRAKDLAAAAHLSAVLEDLRASTPQERGNRSYEVFVSEADAVTFYIKESWDSKEHVDMHVARVAGMHFSGKLAGWLSKPQETVAIRSL